jgi:phospholipid-binding lipoprotein MlaA
VNRAVFVVNDTLDTYLLRPVAYGYDYITPKPIQNNIGNFLSNLSTPVTLANDLLQLEFTRARTTMARFLINTSFGFGGIGDLASEMGFEKHKEDFGQTMAVYGVDDGPFLMLPLLGPSNLRDLTGKVADYFADPLNFTNDDDWENVFYIKDGVSIVHKRAQVLGPLDDMKESSIDYYASIRSLYKQTRDASIKNMDATPNQTQAESYDELDMAPVSDDEIQ